jgi:nicotinate phosphoribosyltransferase
MGALLTDLYQLTMLDAYLHEQMNETAVFELFVRRLPDERQFLVAAGLEQALDCLERFDFTADEIHWLAGQGLFSARLIESLWDFRFTGDVDAMPEGTVCFAGEPLLRVAAPLPQAQLVESRRLNIVHLQTLIASKAARFVLAARGRKLVDFGMRRAHGAEAALFAARAACLAGFAGSATVEAARRYGIPAFGTMAHSYGQAHASEPEAFEAFVRARPGGTTLLIDTYDTERAAAKVIELARRLEPEGIRIGGVRLDSGDLGEHAQRVRRLLDDAGLHRLTIFASGNLDEHRIAALVDAGAPIAAFGVGTSLDTSSDAPSLDAVYKLQSYAGIARRKRSEGKATWPGAKQVWREHDEHDGTMQRDHLRLADEPGTGTALLQPVMRAGRRLGPGSTLEQARAHHAAQMQALPQRLRTLGTAAPPYAVTVSEKLRSLARAVDRRTRE